MKVTRRTLARMLAATAAIPLVATAEAEPQTDSEETRSAREAARTNAQQLAQVKVPMNIEPAFHFKA